MKLPYSTVLSLCLLVPFAVPAATPGPDGPPNIIVIFTDDQGFADLGCQRIREDVKTPNIDALARRGIRFTHGYVTAPQCEPSRAAILTGRYQQWVGVENNVSGDMRPGIPTIASRLKAAGYVTGMTGKWGVGGGPKWADIQRGRTATGGVDPADLPLLPGARGFDDYFSGITTLYVANYDLTGKALADAPTIVKDDRYRVEVQTEAAVTFINRHAKSDRPFFLYFAPYAPHVPLAAPESYKERFPGVTEPDRRTCLAMVSCIDDGVGRIVEALKHHSLLERTLIWFISDNGAPRNNGSLNEPLTGFKGSLLDGGIRVPFLVSWPGALPEGKVFDPAVSSLDVLPTCLAATGLPQDPQLDGVNILPWLRGENRGEIHDALLFRWSGQSAIRTPEWKLLRAGGLACLYSMRTEDGEQQDQAAEHPEITADLGRRLDEWLAQLPVIEEERRRDNRAGQRPRPAAAAEE